MAGSTMPPHRTVERIGRRRDPIAEAPGFALRQEASARPVPTLDLRDPAAMRAHLLRIGRAAASAHMPDRVVADTHIDFAAYEAFCGDLARRLRRLPAAQAAEMEALAARIAGLPGEVYALLAKRAGRGRTGQERAKAGLYLADACRALQRSARSASGTATDPAVAAILAALDETFLALKRRLVTATGGGLVAGAAAEADNRFRGMGGDGSKMRVGQSYVEGSSYTAAAGVGVTASDTFGVLTANARATLGMAFTDTVLQDSDGTTNVVYLNGPRFGGGLDLGLAGLLSASGAARLDHQSGDFIKGGTPAEAFAVAIKQESEDERASLIFRPFTRSASPAARKLNAFRHGLEDGFNWLVRGRPRLLPRSRPTYFHEAKLGPGGSALPIQEGLCALGAALEVAGAPPGQRSALARQGRRFFPSEREIQAVISAHPADVEMLKATKSMGVDRFISLYPAPTTTAMQRSTTPWRQLTGTVSASAALSAAGPLGAASPLVAALGPSASLSATGSFGRRRIRSETADQPQEALVDAAALRDPDTALRVYGDLWRSFGGASPHPMLRVSAELRAGFGRNAANHTAPHHEAIRDALRAGTDPAPLVRDIAAKLGRLLQRYQAFLVAADQVSSSRAEIVAGACIRINRDVFGGAYAVGEKASDQRSFLGDAHNAHSLALGDLGLCLSLARRAAPRGTVGLVEAEQRYARAGALMENPGLPIFRERLHRRQPISSGSAMGRTTAYAGVTAAISLIDVPAILGGVLPADVPALDPSLGKASLIVEGQSDHVAEYPAVGQRGTFTTQAVTLQTGPGGGLLMRGARALEDRAPGLRHSLGQSILRGLKRLTPQSVLGNASGLRGERYSRKPPQVNGYQPAKRVLYERLYDSRSNLQTVTTPNLARSPKGIAGVVAQFSATTQTTLLKPLRERLGNDLAFIARRMKGDLKPFFVASEEGLDIDATGAALAADPYVADSLFASRFQPILSVVHDAMSYDPARPFARYVSITGQATAWVNPMTEFRAAAEEQARLSASSDDAPDPEPGAATRGGSDRRFTAARPIRPGTRLVAGTAPGVFHERSGGPRGPGLVLRPLHRDAVGRRGFESGNRHAAAQFPTLRRSSVAGCLAQAFLARPRLRAQARPARTAPPRAPPHDRRGRAASAPPSSSDAGRAWRARPAALPRAWQTARAAAALPAASRARPPPAARRSR
jgi:hypothetical protein